jgi:putative ABC transport system permease protein
VSGLRPLDIVRVGSVGVRARPLRSALSALGIAIGIAAMVAVVGIGESSRADLLRQLDRLGTDLLIVSAGEDVRGEDAALRPEARVLAGRIGPVRSVASTARLPVNVRRSDRIPATETGGIAVRAADTGLLSALGGTARSGRFLDEGSARLPVVVLGSVAAQRLGIARVTVDGSPTQVWLGDRWFGVGGVLDPLELAPEIDRSALVGEDIAREVLGWDGVPSALYVRADPEQVAAVRRVLARTVKPDAPEQVQVSRPSDALAARAATKTALNPLLLGLGSVVLLVGGIGIANVMVVSVLERRGEIGLRRAIGATRTGITLQFLCEALLLAAIGGATGAALGAGATAAYARSQGWVVAIPPETAAAGVAVALAVGAVSGLYPALRAARLSPTEALRSG